MNNFLKTLPRFMQMDRVVRHIVKMAPRLNRCLSGNEKADGGCKTIVDRKQHPKGYCSVHKH